MIAIGSVFFITKSSTIFYYIAVLKFGYFINLSLKLVPAYLSDSSINLFYLNYFTKSLNLNYF